MLLRLPVSVCADRQGASLDATDLDALARADEVLGGAAVATFGAAAGGAFAGAGGGDCAGAAAAGVFGGVAGACAVSRGPSAQVVSTSSISFL